MNIDEFPVGTMQPIDDDNVNNKKRFKKVDGTYVSGASNGSVASFEDDRRVQ
jgi:hypothetical protein